MDNHYHLFVKTLLPNITNGMHFLNASYANWFKAKHKIVGVVFQGRYKSILVDNDNYCLQLSAYIHLNPLRAKIVQKLRDYRWSSYLDYVGKRRSIERLDTDFILGQFDNARIRARKKYSRFVFENIAMDNPLKAPYKGIAVGNTGFIKKVQDKIDAIGSQRELIETKGSNKHTAEKVIKQVMTSFSIKKDELLLKRRGNIYRPLTMYLIKRYTDLDLRSIGEMFSMDYAAVSQSCKRFEDKAQTDRGVLKLKNKAEKNLKKC